MSRRTFPRAAAGLIAAALGTTTPANAQAPNPWRGEPTPSTAPAPRAVPKQSMRIEISYRSGTGFGVEVVTQSVMKPGLPVAPAPREVAVTTTACPAPTAPVAAGITYHTGEPVVTNTRKPLALDTIRVLRPLPVEGTPLPLPRYLTHYPQYVPAIPPALESTTEPVVTRSPLKPLAAPRAMPPVVQPVGYTVPVPLSAPRYMPPPAPLPIPLPMPRFMPVAPQAEVIVPVQVEVVFPEKGTRPVVNPSSNVIPFGQPQPLESVRPSPVGQGRR